jgi:hypothetical protein
MGISKRKLDDDDDVEEVVDQTFWEPISFETEKGRLWWPEY